MQKKKFMYGITDIKFPPSDTDIKPIIMKKHPLDFYKFRLPPELKGIERIPKTRVPRRLWTTPDTLVQLCPEPELPEVFKWTNVDVSHWLDRLGFPQYRNTFFHNFINGRRLLLVDAAALAAMNVRRFDHIKKITEAIRKLYRIEMVLFSRSISLPPRYPETHFKFYRVQTGLSYDRTRPKDLWRMMKILREPPIYENHWATLERWLKHIPDYQTERIGYAPRRNLYKVKKEPIRVVSKPPAKPCCCMPPCECEWTEKHLRKPWILKYLRKLIPVEDDDLMVCVVCRGDCSGVEQEGEKCVCNSGKTGEFPDNKCKCIPPCECKWNEKDLSEPYVLSVLKIKLTRRYTVDVDHRSSNEIDRSSCRRIRCSDQIYKQTSRS